MLLDLCAAHKTCISILCPFQRLPLDNDDYSDGRIHQSSQYTVFHNALSTA